MLDRPPSEFAPRCLAHGVAILTLTLVLGACVRPHPIEPLGEGHPASPASAAVFVPPPNPFASAIEPVAAPDAPEMPEMPGMSHDQHASPTTAPAAAGYTCPMHQEIRSDQPGKCPKCGMSLVPAKGKNTDDHDRGALP